MGLRGGQSGVRALADDLALTFGEVAKRCKEGHAIRHQTGSEMNVVAEPVELGDDDRARLPVAAGLGEGLVALWRAMKDQIFPVRAPPPLRGYGPTRPTALRGAQTTSLHGSFHCCCSVGWPSGEAACEGRRTGSERDSRVVVAAN